MRRLAGIDVLSGLMFAGMGTLALILGRDLNMGTAARMGPGYVPWLLSWTLIVLGAAMAGRGLLRGGARVDFGHWRPVILVTVAALSFGLLLEAAGLLPALVVLVVLAALGGAESRRWETVGLTVFLAVLSIGIFKIGLGMSFPILRGVW